MSATQQYLEKLHGRSLFSYLRKLLAKGQDFSQKAGDLQTQHKEEQLQQHLSHKAQDMVGQKFENRDRSIHIEVDASGMLRETRNGNSVMRFFSENFLEALAARRLVPVQ